MREAYVRRFVWTVAIIELVVLVSACVSVDLSRYDLSPPSAERLRQEDEAIRLRSGLDDNFQFDRDGDGALNRDEWRTSEWDIYLIFDENLDGLLSMREYVRMKCGTRIQLQEFFDVCAPRAVIRFSAISGDNSGAGSFGASRFHDDLDMWFRRNDRNHDGVVNRDEMSLRPIR